MPVSPATRRAEKALLSDRNYRNELRRQVIVFGIDVLTAEEQRMYLAIRESRRRRGVK
jgi:hypothetical protein